MNPLQNEIDEFLEKIALNESLNFQTKTHLTNRKNQLMKQIDSCSKRSPLMISALILGDITGPSEKGWKINYHSGFSVKVNSNEMIASIDKLISHNGMRYVANCYEIFESFLFNILGEFFNEYPSYTLCLKKQELHHDNYKEFLRKYYRSKNNKDLFKLLRIISSKFENSERSNNTGFNLNDWYYMVSSLRHGIVHSMFILDSVKINFNSQHWDLFNKKISHSKDLDKIELQMSYEECREQICLFAEIGFLVFKTLSIEIGEDWKIFNDMEKNYI